MYQNSAPGNLKIRSAVYTFDFGSMCQINTTTNYKRPIQRVTESSPSQPPPMPVIASQHSVAMPTTSGGVQWYYRDDRGRFSPYNLSNSQSIEKMYQNSAPGHLKIRSAVYTFDFGSMCQVNTKTNYKRPIQRVTESSPSQPPPRPVIASQPPVYGQPPSETPTPTPQEDVLIILRGPQDSLEAAKVKLEQKLKNYVEKETITIPFACSAEFKSTLESVASRHNVNCMISSASGKAQSVVKMEGINSEVQATVKAVQQLIIDHQFLSATYMATPPEWEEQNDTTEVFSVHEGNAEWVRVEQNFRATLSKKIVYIWRIQNTWLWEKYCHHKKRARPQEQWSGE